MKNLPILVLLGLFAVSGTSTAAIVSSTGPVDVIAAPASVGHNVLQSDTLIRAFDEQQNVTLGSALDMNGGPGGQFTGLTLNAGTRVNSHLIHVDPVQATELNHIFDATVTFEHRILGFVWVNEDLDASDSPLGLAATTYPTGFASRGAGSADPGSDMFAIDLLDPKTLDITEIVTGFKGGLGNMDQIRVVTAVPVPAAAWLFVSGVISLVSFARRKQA